MSEIIDLFESVKYLYDILHLACCEPALCHREALHIEVGQCCCVCQDCVTYELGKSVSGCIIYLKHVAHVQLFKAVHLTDQDSERVSIKVLFSVALEVVELQLLDALSMLA